jgi:phosphatidylglycerol:prolipoprotein diacylglycerol transferase
MNYTTISFPGLGLEMNPPSYFSIGSFTVHFYGVIIALGLVLAVIYGMRRSKQFGFTDDHILDGVLWIVPFAILCARLYYCVFEWDNYKNNPISIFYIWQGGLAIYGGVIGAAIGIIVYPRIKKLNLGALLDLVSLGFLIGQSIGRWGNFMNREAFGAPTESFLRMGLFNSRTGAFEYYHPTFLYESVWNAIGFVLLHFLSKRRKYDGQIALGYLAWYGLGRALIEGLRTDSLYLGAFRVSQLLAAVTCAAGVILLMVLSFRYHDPKKLYVNQVAEESAEAAETEEVNETEE